MGELRSFGKLALLGGDERQLAMARALERSGWQTALWGLGKKGVDWKEAVHGAGAIILPLPATSDGVRVHCPEEPEAILRFQTLVGALPAGTRIFGGRIPPTWIREAEKRGLPTEDYFGSEVLQLRNALPTVEGALYLAMRELPVTICGTSVAVIGYGRIGSLLAEKLHMLGADVTVFARKRSDVVHASLRGSHAIRLEGEGAESSLRFLPPDCRVIFNTVPARIFPESVLEDLRKECILMELASLPGGFDPACADRLGLHRILASALPGKCFPESAGEILAATVSELLSRPPHSSSDTERNDR